MIKETLKGYLDLTRLHFFFVWPTLFLSGLFLSFAQYDGFGWFLIAKAIVIALLGFEAGFVLNDWVDRNHDMRDVEVDLTKYWRPFGTRPIPAGKIQPNQALMLFFLLAVAATIVSITLPYPHNIFLIAIQWYSYAVEYFYQVKKRSQSLPIAQLIGRTDFTLFPIAGYLANGFPDAIIVQYAAFFYPYTMIHLGLNDLIDVANDRVRGLNSITTMYGINGTIRWMQVFSIIHLIASFFFMPSFGLITTIAGGVGALLILSANMIIKKDPTLKTGLKILPMFHATLLIYSISMIAEYFV